uniref:Glycosyltransferase n=1 Tax=viral metagenome TaxID=1070528 RepID=A0A6C0BS30_9ZZZZ
MKNLLKLVNKKADELEYDEDIKILHYSLFEGLKIEKKDSKLSVALINIPCGGFGDIVNCKTFSDYLKQWYPNMKVSICTAAINKFKSLGIKTKDLIELEAIKIYDENEGAECQPFDNLKFKNKIPKFDLIVVVPMVNEQFSVKKLQKLIPYANKYNSFAVSEYNGEYPPYAFPIGVGKGQLGLMLTSMNIKKHNFIKAPYALAYTAGHDRGQGVVTHTNHCILSFIEMICKKYCNKYNKLQMIIPPWFCSDSEKEISLLTSPQLKTKCANIIKKYFGNSHLVLKGEVYSENNNIVPIVKSNKNNKEFILRGDILPKPREEFISLIKYSLPDVLLTGDQSVTDGIAYSNMNKRIWYQISPWKKDLAYELSKAIPNKYLDNFRTSCGTLKGIKVDLNNRNLVKQNDFRKKGKIRMDSILKFYSLINEPDIQCLMDCIDHSRYKDSAIKKFNKKIELKYNL